jgi:guanylate kinase
MRTDGGKLFVLSSPSGGGKSSVIACLLRQDPSFRYSVSATTRRPRDGEKDGVDYIFMEPKSFEEKIRRNAFLEWASVHGFIYGTPKDAVLGWLEEGRKILLNLDVQGAETIKKNFPESVLIFLLPPSLSVLKERLRKRGTDSPEAVERRLRTAEEEMKLSDRYDFLVFNDDFKETVNDVQAIVQ